MCVLIGPIRLSPPIYGKLEPDAETFDAMRAGLLQETPARRFSEPDEIAAAAVYFASTNHASWSGADGSFMGA